jgi:hypothetical protein
MLDEAAHGQPIRDVAGLAVDGQLHARQRRRPGECVKPLTPVEPAAEPRYHERRASACAGHGGSRPVRFDDRGRWRASAQPDTSDGSRAIRGPRR